MTEQFDLVVLGAGPGGYVAAIRSAQLGLKTALIEKDNTLGGTCLNVGCIPSKTLLKSSQLVYEMQTHFRKHGIEIEKHAINFSQMMKRKAEVISTFTQGIDFLLKKNKVQRFLGKGTLKDEHTVEVEGKSLVAKNILLATGSESISLPFLPFDEKRVVSSTGVLSLEKLPKKLLIIGAGIIGLELGSVYQRLGCEVTFIEFLDHICPNFDSALSKEALKIFSEQNMKFHLSHRVVSAKVDREIVVTAQGTDKQQNFSADVVLVAIGRKPYSEGLGLEKLNIEKNEKGFIQVDGCFRTKVRSIFAIGDLIEGPMLAHKASEEGVAVAEFLANRSVKMNYITIANVAYTYPEIASVGFTEEKLKEKNISYISGQFPFKANSRAKCNAEDTGFVKILADKKSHRILGLHMIGPQVSEMIAFGSLAMQNFNTVEEISRLSFAHPTLSEAIKEAAFACYDRPIHS